ncbi:MAG: hypothetical protein MZV63_00100 [Marinilabiliales bacterium]|nr:hypothetical protein [Marinilabiliales bacterium]
MKAMRTRGSMVPADLSKGETGIYKIITEGLDNDDDGNLMKTVPAE